jgi:peptidoglycan/LPS O-acetylase OafA/YrhL
METSLSTFKNRYQWTNYFAALSIVAGAAISCVLCFSNDNPGASIGLLLVFGMALIAVLGGRSEARLTLPIQRRRALEMQVMHGPTLQC